MSGSNANSEQLEAQALLYNHVFHFIDSMSLKCAVELGIPDAIDRHGRPISLLDLLSALNLPPNKSSHLRRLMRLLARSGFFTVDKFDNSYSLTPLSRLLLTNAGDPCSAPSRTSAVPFLLAMLDPV